MSAFNTVYGNDIEENAILVSTLRILIYLSQKDPIFINQDVFNTINSHFSNKDFIFDSLPLQKRFNFILGNPPYIEYRVLEKKPETGYGTQIYFIILILIFILVVELHILFLSLLAQHRE